MLRSKNFLIMAASVVMSVGIIGCASTQAGSTASKEDSNSVAESVEESVAESVEVTSYTLDRYSIDTQQDYAEFQERYEQAVPAFTPAIFEGAANWDEVVERTAAIATNGFLIYFKLPTTSPARGGLNERRGAEYLMGNHTISETMHRINPAVMLHAPLRVMIFENERGDAVFEIERPSDLFGSYGDEKIAEVGLMLDGKLESLFGVLGMAVPPGLER